jgi:hypothetical protein
MRDVISWEEMKNTSVDKCVQRRRHMEATKFQVSRIAT